MSSQQTQETTNTPEHMPALSASSLKEFRLCPLKYRLGYIDRLPSPGSPATLRGTLVHRVLENMFAIEPEKRTEANVTRTIDTAWEQVAVTEEVAPILAQITVEELKSQARDLVHAYFSLENPANLDPSGCEIRYETVLDSGIRVRGYIDRVEINAAGSVRIVDYKTGKAPHSRYTSDYEFQMNMYALMHRELYGILPAVTRLLFLGGAVPQHLDFVPTEMSLDVFADEIADIWNNISRCLHSGEFEACPNRLCNWCNFKDICPAFGGTPPVCPAQRIEYMKQIGPLPGVDAG